MSWQSSDHGKLLIPAITRSCLLISPHMEWRLQEIKPCIRMNITHCCIPCNRSSVHHLLGFLFFPCCSRLLLFVPASMNKKHHWAPLLSVSQVAYLSSSLLGHDQKQVQSSVKPETCGPSSWLLRRVYLWSKCTVLTGWCGSKRWNSFGMALVMVHQVKDRDVKWIWTEGCVLMQGSCAPRECNHWSL